MATQKAAAKPVAFFMRCAGAYLDKWDRFGKMLTRDGRLDHRLRGPRRLLDLLLFGGRRPGPVPENRSLYGNEATRESKKESRANSR
jgi:hypothetical protein